MEKISIKETVKLPSRALELMIEGLLKQKDNPDFEIIMDSYGGVYDRGSKKEICYGCAATCTIQHLANKNLDPLHIDDTRGRAKYLGFEEKELSVFETCIDAARKGDIGDLFRFFDIRPGDQVYDRIFGIWPWCLDSEDWEEQIPEIQKCIDELKTLGH